ncbi:uncharacterized protein LOC143746318 [Siphateles boraxobius]
MGRLKKTTRHRRRTSSRVRDAAAKLDPCCISGKTCKLNSFKNWTDSLKAKAGDIGSKLKKILQQIQNDKSNINAERTAVHHGLPLLLGEDPTDFYKTCFDYDDNEDMSNIEIGILTVIPEDFATAAVPYSLHLDATTTAIILEGTVVVDDLENLPQAMCLLFGLNYALNLRVSCSIEEHIRLHTESDFVPWPQAILYQTL